MSTARTLQILMMTFCLGACGGGGGSSSPSPEVDPTPVPAPGPAPEPEPEPEPEAPLLEGLEAASRLASRATFGMNYSGIVAIDQAGEAQWLEQQFREPIGAHDPIVTDLLKRSAAGEFAAIEEETPNVQAVFRRAAWWQQTLNAQDQLRQRVAYTLSQIFVVSDTVNALLLSPHSLSTYYDTLLQHAFGNYRDLLRAVTLHPAMGVYLSHIGNAKADPAANTYPDENYAREVMQLFSIGLYELNVDGSEKRNVAGQLIPTYDNDDIREFARVFTGLHFGESTGSWRRRLPNFQAPMEMFEAYHDSEEKQLLRGQTLPAGQAGMQDIEDGVDNLFNHPNVGPFIGRQLIQRLVTSNPSPAYVQRVAEAFNGEGGVRGDMQAVLRAVLLDPEARAIPDEEAISGKLREPLLRIIAAMRQMNVYSPDGFYANSGYLVQRTIGQHPLSAPSVFNFYLPTHSPLGGVGDAGLVAPEFQITNSSTVVAVSNLIDAAVLGGVWNDISQAPFQRALDDINDYLALAQDPEKLMDRLDLVMAYGTLSVGVRQSIIESVAQIEDPELRVRAAIYLVLVSPDQAVEL